MPAKTKGRQEVQQPIANLEPSQTSAFVFLFFLKLTRQEFFVPPAAEYNSSSAHFLSALRQNVHIWDATSGEYVRKLTNVSPM